MSNWRRAKLVFDSFLTSRINVAAKDVPCRKDLIKAPIRKMSCGLLVTIVGSGVVIGLGVSKLETIPYSNRTHFVIFSSSSQKKMVDRILESHKGYEDKLNDKFLPGTHPQTIRVRRIVNRIAEALQREIISDREGSRVLATAHLDGIKWNVFVAASPELDAGVMDTCTIGVSTGLLDHFERDEEIAMIICHEVAHIVARHEVEKLTNPMFLATSARRPEDFYFPKFPKLTTYFLRFPHRLEMEADYIGILLLASAGYNPRAAPGVLTKMAELTGEDTDKYHYFSTHPTWKERAEKLAQAHIMEEALSRYQDVQSRNEGTDGDKHV